MHHVLFGNFDIVTVAALLAVNVWCFRRRVRLRPLAFFLIAVPLFGLVLPLVSMGFETDRFMKEDAGPVVDAFETAYTLFRFPEYWVAGWVQILAFFYGQRLEKRRRQTATEKAA
jgi:hypothetical protein